MITFQKIAPEDIETLPEKAVKYLDDAIKRTPASTSRLDVTLDIAKKGYGNIYLIFDEIHLIGACYLLVYPTKEGRVVAPVLLGGDNLDFWQEDFYHFLYEFSEMVDAFKIRFIGRKGWSKIFPKSRIIGYIYEHEIEPITTSP